MKNLILNVLRIGGFALLGSLFPYSIFMTFALCYGLLLDPGSYSFDDRLITAGYVLFTALIGGGLFYIFLKKPVLYVSSRQG